MCLPPSPQKNLCLPAGILYGCAFPFRPKLSLHDGLVHVSLDMADLTTHEKARVAAVTVRTPAQTLAGPDDLSTLIPMLQVWWLELLMCRGMGRISAGFIGVSIA